MYLIVVVGIGFVGMVLVLANVAHAFNILMEMRY